MRSIAIVILAALLATFGAACMGDDEGEQSRRPAAFGEDDPATWERTLSLSLTVVSGPSCEKCAVPASGSVWEHYSHMSAAVTVPDDPNTRYVPAPCVSAPAPGRTCRWLYWLFQATQNGLVTLRAGPSAGARVNWTGCESGAPPNDCYINLRRTQKQLGVVATFELDPKAATG